MCGLLKAEGFDTILVVVTKYVYFTVKKVEELFAKDIIHIYDYPNSFVSNHDKFYESVLVRVVSCYSHFFQA